MKFLQEAIMNLSNPFAVFENGTEGAKLYIQKVKKEAERISKGFLDTDKYGYTVHLFNPAWYVQVIADALEYRLKVYTENREKDQYFLKDYTDYVQEIKWYMERVWRYTAADINEAEALKIAIEKECKIHNIGERGD